MLLQISDAARERGTNPFLYQKCHLAGGAGTGQETPVESLLTQYQDARAQKQNTDALEKQINERLEGVLSRWLLLNNNTIPTIKKGIEFQ